MIVVRHQVSLICRDTHRTQLASLTKNSLPWGLRKIMKINMKTFITPKTKNNENNNNNEAVFE